MVGKLTHQEKLAIEQAVLAAEKESGAELAVVIAQASDPYRSVAFISGGALGTLLAAILWHERLLVDIYALVSLPLILALLFASVPFLRHFCRAFTPKRVLRARAGQRAAMEYMHLVHHTPVAVPFLMLFVSRAERYVHIYSSREVRDKIPDREWDAVVKTLTNGVRAHGFISALALAIKHAGEMLKGPFPADGRERVADVVELKE